MSFKEWKHIDELAKALQAGFGPAPETAVVLGSGLGSVAGELEHSRSIEYSDLPGWPATTVPGHAGRVHVGRIGNTDAAILQGRAHVYEGYSPAEAVRPVRAAVTWGVRTLLLTNAAGGIDPRMTPGRLMLIEDQINLTGLNPLIGPNDESRGARFPDLTDMYDPKLRSRAMGKAKEIGVPLCCGVYAGMLGPNYETPAEVRMLAGLGAHAVGMSTVLEAIAARHLGAKLMGISCIANMAAGLQGARLDHGDVQLAGEAASRDLGRLLDALIAVIGEEN